MKVRITKCSSENYWYKNNIGEIFETPTIYYGCYVKNGNPNLLIYGEDCEIINEAKEILKGADKLSEQLNKSEWAKMPQKKQEETVKEYELNIDFITLKKGEDVLVGSYTNIHTFESKDDKLKLAIPNTCLQLALQQGIIREKKSKAEEMAESIVSKLDAIPKTSQSRYEIILEELEKAGVK